MLELKNLSVSSSPHIRASQSTASIMRDVCIALLPALIASVYFFGFRALTVVLVSVAACVFFEWGYRKIMKLDCTIGDGSAVVTGLLLAFGLPGDDALLGDHRGRLYRDHRDKAALRRHRQKLYEPGPGGQSLPLLLGCADDDLGSNPAPMLPYSRTSPTSLISTGHDGSDTAGGHENRRIAGDDGSEFLCRQHRRLHRRDVGAAASAGRRVSCRAAGHHTAHPPVLYRNGCGADLPVPAGNDRLTWMAYR